MSKKDNLYKYIQENRIINTSSMKELGYARIYLTMLVKENKIFKIGRGVYSIDKNEALEPLYEFQKNNSKIIYSGFTALSILKFYDSKSKKVQISVPQGYNASRYSSKQVFYNKLDNYGVGAIQVSLQNKTLTIYDLERSICDIIKDQNRFDLREYNKLINYYFNLKDINYQKLLEYSKLLKVSKKVQTYLSLFKA
jgi:hypothetical protein